MPDRAEGTTSVTAGLLRTWSLPDPGSSKYDRGTVLVVGGHRSTPGAVLLAAESALRAGAGKLQIATAAMCAPQLAVAVPEARVVGLPETDDGELAEGIGEELARLVSRADAVLLGPGLMDGGAACELVGALVPHVTGALVVDALATSWLADCADVVRDLAGGCVGTVNPKEAATALGWEAEEVEADLGRAATELSAKSGAVVLCGGPEKWVATPDGDRYVVHVGGPGLGVSGSGDVQAGLVAGLLARGAEPTQAAVWGAYLHGAAGERMATSEDAVGFLARELPSVVPALLADLSG